MSPLLYACVITGLGISNSRQGKEREVLLHKILRVAHSVAQITAKAAQNSPFRCSTMYLKLLICIRSGYYLANFKTAGFNRSPTPPLLILTYSVSSRPICCRRDSVLHLVQCVPETSASLRSWVGHIAARVKLAALPEDGLCKFCQGYFNRESDFNVD